MYDREKIKYFLNAIYLFILLYDLDTSFGINWGGKGNVDYNFTPDSGAAWI